MTLEEFKNLLAGTGIPVAYRTFPTGKNIKPPTMPFAVYQDTGSSNFGADNRVWASAINVQVDLFTKKKNRNIEKTLESVFDSADLYWERETDYDESEKYFRATYELTI